MPYLQKFLRFLDLDRKNHTLCQSCIYHLLSGQDFHPSQLPILWAIAQTEQQGQISQGQIARLLGVSRAAVAVSAKRMERTGLVYRRKIPSDQRCTVVSLTPRGQEVARRARASQERVFARRMEGFSQEELATLVSFYERMNHNLERYRQELEQSAPPCQEEEAVVC